MSKVFSVATYNLGNAKWWRVSRDLRILVRLGADVICVQEGSDRQKTLKRWAKKNKWFYNASDRDGGAAVAVLTKREPTNFTTRRGVRGQYIGNSGAGPENLKTKIISHAKFDDTVDEHVFNTHLIPSVDREDLPTHDKRVSLYTQHIEVLVEMISSKGKDVLLIVVGDFNTDPGNVYVRPLRFIGLKQYTVESTHGRSIFDQVWSNQRPALINNIPLSSDHDAVIARWDVPS